MASILSTTTHKILEVLLANPLKEYKEIELIQTARSGKGAAAEHIKTLIKEGVLSEKRVGRTKILSLRWGSPTLFFFRNALYLQKLKRLAKPTLAAVLLFKEEVQAVASVVILFGSTAAGTASVESDLDILLVSKQSPVIESARKKTEGLFGQRLNLHLYSEEAFMSQITKDSFLQQALLQGVILSGYDFAIKIFPILAKTEKKDRQRLDYFKERISAARRNYQQKDAGAAKEIFNQLQEQLIYYILTIHGIGYESKKNAAIAIQPLPEGKLLKDIRILPFNKKIDKLEALIQEILIRIILEDEGYEPYTGNT